MSEYEDEITRGWLDEAPLSSNNRDIKSSIQKRKIYVGFYKRNITENQIHDYFCRFGKIDKVFMIRDGFGASKGYAFVIYSNEDAVDIVLEAKPHILCGIELITRRAFPKDHPGAEIDSNHNRNKIFIGGIPRNFTKNQLFHFFENLYSNSPLFSVEEVIIPVDPSGTSKGFGFIRFNNEDIVDKILFDYPRIEIGGRSCEIKRAELRDGESPSHEPFTQRHSENVVINRPSTVESTNMYHSDPAPSSQSSLRLVSRGMEKMRHFCSEVDHPPPLSNLTNTDRIINRVASPRKIKRSFSQRSNHSQNSVSDNLDQQTLARIGKIFIDLVSHSIESDVSLKSENSMSSLLISTLHQIIENTKNI